MSRTYVRSYCGWLRPYGQQWCDGCIRTSGRAIELSENESQTHMLAGLLCLSHETMGYDAVALLSQDLGCLNQCIRILDRIRLSPSEAFPVIRHRFLSRIGEEVLRTG